jgi:hypothetical protein
VVGFIERLGLLAGGERHLSRDDDQQRNDSHTVYRTQGCVRTSPGWIGIGSTG